ncbi:hypothetical protein NTJ56_29060 [Burkholderia contaminans]|uniref:hypothetical protein n=1 Tax=Burkholderia contaminans TaxID=488447 RepID=UPI001CF5AF7B|nr:hypothetical protein [Burkholderia contaminans]MCA7913431.1 hypothetical protein [Burkholderia contaminans]UUX41863.1 hypothetical protein NTJ56_29060 [Burkholderia contaminans]
MSLRGFNPPSSADPNRWMASSVAPRCRSIAVRAAATCAAMSTGMQSVRMRSQQVRRERYARGNIPRRERGLPFGIARARNVTRFTARIERDIAYAAPLRGRALCAAQ